MIKIINLEKTDSVFNQYMAELRDVVIQQDRMRFRSNLERIGQVMAYEISKSFEYDDEEVNTPLGIKQIRTMHEQPVIATILRAGLPFHNGMLSMFDQADSAFIAAYRKYDKNEEDSEIRVEYFSSPDIEDRILILCDPLLATGESIVKTLNGLMEDMMPKEIHIAVAVASQDGLDYVERTMSRLPITIWVGSVDEELTARAYVVPGIGDVGDLAYGEKR
ncbi:MAG: uracil phosphoribosyltransferase [bacterium P3]|jgi:uracil phosphoribosyltransferase|nr:MAG: uracil phosphoribosyltransferase [bacterium P3]KWW40612.1 MAG: uracil phosphoribosyltransferase [bacterium F083]